MGPQPLARRPLGEDIPSRPRCRSPKHPFRKTPPCAGFSFLLGERELCLPPGREMLLHRSALGVVQSPGPEAFSSRDFQAFMFESLCWNLAAFALVLSVALP